MLTKISQFIVTFLTDYGLYTWLGLIPVLAIWVYFLNIKRKKNKDLPKSITKKEVNTFLSFLGVAVIVFLFITEVNPYYIGYGHSIDGYEPICHNNQVFCSVNENISKSNRGSHVINYRLQGVDLASGKIKYTTILDKGFKVWGFNSSILLTYSKRDKEIRSFDITTGKLTAIMNEKLAKHNFPELTRGIYECNFNIETKLIDIVSKDGLHVFINPVNMKTVAYPSELVVKKDYEIKRDGIYKYTDTLYQNTTKVIGFNNGPVINKLINYEEKLLSKNLKFIYGEFLLYDKASKNAIILSYETEEKKNTLISCVTTDGKLIWQVNNEELAIGDFFNSNPKFNTCFIENKNIIIDFEGFVFSLNNLNGKLNWAIRL